MNTEYLLLVIILMCVVTFLFRALPFYCMEFFKHHEIVLYLGRILPACVMVVLVIFSLQDVSYSKNPYGIPEIVSVFVTGLTHVVKRNIFISMLLGTACYVLLQKYLLMVL